MKALAIHPSSRLVDKIEIATPCHADWDDMVGDERTRHCGECRKNVYNISEMTAVEVKDLVTATEGRVCVRLYRRKDGTVLTSDCPVGLAERAWRRARNTALASAALALTLFTGAFFFLFGRTCGPVDGAQGWVESQQVEHMAGGLMPVEPTMGEAVEEPVRAPQHEMGDVAFVPQAKMGKMKINVD